MAYARLMLLPMAYKCVMFAALLLIGGANKPIVRLALICEVRPYRSNGEGVAAAATECGYFVRVIFVLRVTK